MSRSLRKQIVLAVAVMILYGALTQIFDFMSYNAIQFRVAEALCVFPYFFPVTAFGVVAGCLLSNILGGLGTLDTILGTLATIMCCFCIVCLGGYRENTRYTRVLIALLVAVINGILVGLVISFYGTQDITLSSFWTNAIVVAAGEFVVMILIGYPIMRYLPGSKIYKYFEGDSFRYPE